MGKIPTPQFIPVSVTQHDQTTIIVYKETGDSVSLRIATSSDGTRFKLDPNPVVIARTIQNENIDLCSHFRLSAIHDDYILSYEKKQKNKHEIVFARSKNLKKFKFIKSKASAGMHHSGSVVSKTNTHTKKNEYIFYYGTPTITAAESTDLKTWKTSDALLVAPRSGFFDHGHISIITAHSITEGIAVLYEARSYENGREQLLIGGALFSHDNPYKILWRSEMPFWEYDFHKDELGAIDATTSEWTTCGAVFKKDIILVYLTSKDGSLSVVAMPNRFHTLANRKYKPPSHIERHHANPIIEPTPHYEWQSQATFNPAAVKIGDNIHLLYRAMGSDGISRLGHSSSSDGVVFNRRSYAQPVYEPIVRKTLVDPVERYDRILHPSGGGWAGCEDPRAVIIDKRVFVTYVAFEGWHSMQIALTSISIDDLEKGRWNWQPPTMLSAPGEVHKNWVLFPEKIKGKFALLHSITPDVRIEYLDDLNNAQKEKSDTRKNIDGTKIEHRYIKSTPPSGGRKHFWDNRVRGAGPPPLRTDIGWLLIYHAGDMHDPNKYKIGAMILDIEDPTKILYRSPEPILSPEMPYENDWKPGVVYASGAIIKDGNLMVYYGGGDKHVCLAETPLKKLLDWLVTFGKVS